MDIPDKWTDHNKC